MNRRSVLVSALVTVAVPTRRALAQTEPPLAGRVGGTLESFDAIYGPAPASDGPAFLGTTYDDVPGASSAIVSEHEGRLTRIHLFAPRPPGEEWTSDEPHGSNWSIPAAHAMAELFVPADASLGAAAPARLGVIRTIGRSAALAAEVPDAVYDWVDEGFVRGEFSYVLMLDETDTKASSVVVMLEVEEPLP